MMEYLSLQDLPRRHFTVSNRGNMTPPENNRQSGNEHSLLGLVAVGAPQPLYPAVLPKLQTSLPFHLSSTTSPTSSVDTHSNISYPSQSTSPGMLQEVKDYVRLPLLPRMDSMSDTMVNTKSLKRVADDIIQQSGRHLGHSPPIQHGEQRSPQTKLPCFAELVEGVKDPSPPATPTHGKVSMVGSPVGNATQFEKLAWNESGKRRRLDDTQGGLTYKPTRAAMYDPAREEYGSPKSIHPTPPSQPPVTYRHRPSLPAPQLQHLPPVTHARHQSSPGSHAHSSSHVTRPHGRSAPAAYDPASGGVVYGHSSRSYRLSSEPDGYAAPAQSGHSAPASYAYPTPPSNTYPTPASSLYGPASPNPQSPPVPIPYPAPRSDGYAVQHATPYATPASNYPPPGHYASASHHSHQALSTSSIYPPPDSVYSPEMYYHQQGPYSNYQFQNVGLDNQFNRKRRGNLPKEATTILKAWFNAHRDSPYPSEDEKVHLVNMTKLNMNQVSNWFINARRRAPQKEQRNSSVDATNEATGPMPGVVPESLSQS